VGDNYKCELGRSVRLWHLCSVLCVALILEYISIEVDRREFPAAERGAEGHKFSADRRRQAGDEHQWDVLEHRRHSESLAWTERHVLRWDYWTVRLRHQRSLLNKSQSKASRSLACHTGYMWWSYTCPVSGKLSFSEYTVYIFSTWVHIYCINIRIFHVCRRRKWTDDKLHRSNTACASNVAIVTSCDAESRPIWWRWNNNSISNIIIIIMSAIEVYLLPFRNFLLYNNQIPHHTNSLAKR